MKTKFFLFLFFFTIFSFSQAEMYGKYKLAEPTGNHYEGFALFSEGKAVLLKVFTKKYLFHKELPQDSLSLFFNPGISDIKEFPVELNLVQTIEANWKMIGDTLVLSEGNSKVKFRKYLTSFIVSESQMSGFTASDPLMYYKFQGYDNNNRVNSKLNLLSSNQDEIPSNYDLYEFFSDVPQVILIKIPDGSLIDSIYFEYGVGEITITVASKASRGKDNVFSNYELNRKRLSGYFYNEIHGYEYLYYHPKEISETIVGKKFLLKREGWYEQGVKHGKWMYYSEIGGLTTVEIWKKGELKSTKTDF